MKKQFLLAFLLLILYQPNYAMDKSNDLQSSYDSLKEQKIPTDDDNWTILLGKISSTDSSNELLEQLLLDDFNDTSIPNIALCNACTQGALNNVKTLIKHGAQIDNGFIDTKKTPLMLSIEYGFYKICSLLLKKGANPNVRDITGNTALIWTCTKNIFANIIHFRQFNKKPDIFENIDLSMNNENVSKALEPARMKFIKLLLKYGTNKSIKGFLLKDAAEWAETEDVTNVAKFIESYTYEPLKCLFCQTNKPKPLMYHCSNCKTAKYCNNTCQRNDWKDHRKSCGMKCNTCGIIQNKQKKLLLCSGCKKVQYCNQECQRADWKNHKNECRKHK